MYQYPYGQEYAPQKKKNDLGGAFVFVICIIILIVLTLSLVPYIVRKHSTSTETGTSQSEVNKSDGLTLGQRNAVESAKQYISMYGMSYSGLVKQLKFEGYSDAEAEFGASNCGADWNQQAVLAAKQYLSVMPMSKKELINQLTFEGFTEEQAAFAAAAVGYT